MLEFLASEFTYSLTIRAAHIGGTKIFLARNDLAYFIFSGVCKRRKEIVLLILSIKFFLSVNRY